MKKRFKIVIGIVFAVFLLVACSLLWMVKNSIGISTGTCLATDTGKYLIILDNSPISMNARRDNGSLFDGLETGDKLLIVHDGIAESYPGRTGVYLCLKVGEGGEIPKSIIEELREMGWLPAADDATLSSGEKYTEPPALTVISGEKGVTALRGTYSWEYQNADGTFTGIESDSLHPLDSREHLPELLISEVEETEEIPFYAIFEFEAEPDEVSVRFWNEECWNDVSAESRQIEVQKTKVTSGTRNESVMHFNIGLQQESGIYEVTAKWNSSEEYGGTAYYSFYTVIDKDGTISAEE